MRHWAKGLLAASILLGFGSASAGSLVPHVSAAAALTASQTKMQQQLTNALNQRLDSYTISYSGTKASLKTDVDKALEAAMAANDYLHYIVKSYATTATFKGNAATVVFKFTYWESLEQTKLVQQRVTKVLSNIVSKSMNDHQKAKAIHDWIVANLAYDTKLVSHSAYDGLFKGSTVCQGYALLTYEMMKQAGIPVRIVEGTSRGQAHAWNLIQLGGQWYHIDTTWDDPVPNVAGRVTYNYYNVTDTQLRADHAWKSADYPKAVTAYEQTLQKLAASDKSRSAFYTNLYNTMGYIYLTDAYTVTSVQGLIDKITAAASQGQKTLTFRYTRGSTVTADLKKALAAQTNLSKFSYTTESYSRTPSSTDKLIRLTLVYA